MFECQVELHVVLLSSCLKRSNKTNDAARRIRLFINLRSEPVIYSLGDSRRVVAITEFKTHYTSSYFAFLLN